MNTKSVKNWLFFVIIVFFSICVTTICGEVQSPLQVKIVLPDDVSKGLDLIEAKINLYYIPGGGESKVCVRVAISTEGIVTFFGKPQQIFDCIPGTPVEFPLNIVLKDEGSGELRIKAQALDEKGNDAPWGAMASYSFLRKEKRTYVGHSGQQDLEEKRLEWLKTQGKISLKDYDKAKAKLYSGQGQTDHNPKSVQKKTELDKLLDTINKVQVAEPLKAAGVSRVTVSGLIQYKGKNATWPNFIDKDRPVRFAKVEFYDRKDSTDTKLVSQPAEVLTDAIGNYSASVPANRDDGSAVNIVVKVRSEGPNVKIHKDGTADSYAAESSPTPVSGPSMTINITFSETTPNATINGAFSVLDMLVMSAGHNIINLKTGVGVDFGTLAVTFPNGEESCWYTGKEIFIADNAKYDWDRVQHECSHYIQDINSLSDSPGGDHPQNWKNLTGHRGLSKEQALKLAYGEAWATFYMLMSQKAMKAQDYGLYAVGDSWYDGLVRYNIEMNAETYRGAGEDCELGVQRILWDLYDQAIDEHDEIAFGAQEMWNIVNTSLGTHKPWTIGEIYSVVITKNPPVGVSYYSVGNATQVQLTYGRLFADHNIGPSPVSPSENDMPSTKPKFKWKTKGARDEGETTFGYHLNKFFIEFWNKDKTTLIFKTPDITLADDDHAEAEWEPTDEQWTTIKSGDSVVQWVVKGSDQINAPTGPEYYGLSSTLSGVDLALVIDDTGSMWDDIDGVKEGLLRFLDIIASLELVYKPTIQVVTFKDSVTQRLISNNIEEIKNVVSSLYASGGEDCPESSAEALLEVSENVKGSWTSFTGLVGSIYFATDASPHAGYDLAGIKQILQNKGIRVITVLSGDCTSESFEAAGEPEECLSKVLQSSQNPDAKLQSASRGDSTWNEFDDIIGTGPDISAMIAFSDLSYGTEGVFKYIYGLEGTDQQINTVVNAALGAIIPAIVDVQPYDLPQGDTLNIVISGLNTNFSSESSVVFEGNGITVNSVTPISANKLFANITVAESDPLGIRNVKVITPFMTTREEAISYGVCQVVIGTSYPRISSIQPTYARQGQKIDLLISIQNVDLTALGTVTMEFDRPLIVNSLTVLSPNTLRAEVEIPFDNTFLGLRDLTIRGTGTEITAIDIFLVTWPETSVPTAKLVSIEPTSCLRGQILDVNIVGENTSFQSGETILQFSGSGIIVEDLSVIDATNLSARIQIDFSANPGFRDVIVQTYTERLVLPQSFYVSDFLINYLRVDKWNLSLNPSKPAKGSMSLSGEFNAKVGVVVPGTNGITYNFHNDAVSESFANGNFKKQRGAKYTYKDTSRSGSSLVNIGGSSRSKFSVKTKGNYDALRGITPMEIGMESGTFNDDVIIQAVRKGKGGNIGKTGATFNIAKAFYISPELYIDSLLAKRVLNKPDKDSLRFAGRFPGAPRVNPANDTFILSLEFTTIEVPPNAWTVGKSGNLLTYKGTLGGKSRFVLKLNNVNRSFSLNATAMNIDEIGKEVAIGISFGTFSRVNALVLEQRVSSKLEQLIY